MNDENDQLAHGHAIAMQLVRQALGEDQLCGAIQDAVSTGITFALGYGIALGGSIAQRGEDVGLEGP